MEKLYNEKFVNCINFNEFIKELNEGTLELDKSDVRKYVAYQHALLKYVEDKPLNTKVLLCFSKFYDDFKKIKQKEENKDFLMKSSNFQKNNYNQIKEKYNKNHKKVYSQITPELNIEELSMNYIKYPLSNKNKINDFILTVNKFNPHSDNIKYKINNKNQNNKNDNKKSSIFNKENLESPLLNKEINLNQTNTNSLSSFS